MYILKLVYEIDNKFEYEIIEPGGLNKPEVKYYAEGLINSDNDIVEIGIYSCNLDEICSARK